MIVGSLELPITVTGADRAVASVRNVDREAAAAANRGLKALATSAESAMKGANDGIGALSQRIRLLGEGLRGVDTRAGSMAALVRTEQTLRQSLASGNLTLERRIILERTLRDTQQARQSGSIGAILRDRARGALGAAAPLLGGLGLTLGGAALASGIATTLTEAVAASGRFATSLRVLESTSRVTNVPLALLQRTSAALQRSLGLTATTTNTMTATAVRFTATAGRANDTGLFLTRWLDLAASRGLTAAEAMQALETTMAGQDEGLNRLGLRNPSLIYKQWGAGADEASQKGAIVNEVLTVGAAVAGSYAERMATAQGAVERLAAAKENFLVALGQAITGGTGYTGVLGVMTASLGRATAWVNAHRDQIGLWVRDLATVTSGVATLVGWIASLSGAIMKLPQLRFGRWLWGALGRLGAGDEPGDSVGASTADDNPFAQRGSFGDPRGFGGITALAPRTPFQFGGPAPAVGGGGRTGRPGTGAAGASPFPTLLAGGPAGIANTMAGGALGVRPLLAQPITTPIRVNAKIEAPGFVAEVQRFMTNAGRIISGGMARGLSSSIQAAIGAAFDGGGVLGVIKAFGATMLSAVGGIFIDLGETYLMYGGIMSALATLLPNPFTAGAAGLAIGVALIALGSALSAVASGGGKRGGGGGGAFSGHGGGGGDQFGRVVLAPRAAPVGGQMAPTGRTGTPTTQPAIIVNANILSPSDPTWQRQLSQSVKAGVRRGLDFGSP